ncbi:hypothetical protein [Actinophytocola oryzae]|uniref:Uncharacterized protein n=1 Tax=Actinophytocola oryzae TaxID=502181 RepID=A0A4R7VVE9_9PSEU|nr:hypothetical protein [Actinophytocola oryzae]TDV53595.1 hypothetical protein CLV71_10463 [Actinophytocola oryzae]
MNDDVFLGMELAVARVADELHRVTAAGPSPLRDTEYPDAADVLWRWVDAQEDAAVWAFVRAYTTVADRARVRESLTMDDFYTIMTFARRCVLAALRNEDPGAAEAAFDALSVIDVERVDWRDVVVVASLASYAARRVGLEPDEVLVGAVPRAQQAVGDIIARAVMDDVDIHADWGYRELRTAAGPVLLESDSGLESDDLLNLALRVADLIEDDGTYEVTDAGVAHELPAVWLGNAPDTVEARRKLRGCVKVHAEPVGVRFRDFLLVFVADAAEDAHAEAVAAAARHDGATPQLGIAVGSRCAVAVASSAVVGQPSIEDARSMARFEEPLRSLLAAVVNPPGDG